MRPPMFLLVSAIAALTTGCGTGRPVTEASSRAIAKIRAGCSVYPRCTVSIVDTGDPWAVTTHVRPQSPDQLGWDGDTYTVSKRLDRITRVLTTE